MGEWFAKCFSYTCTEYWYSTKQVGHVVRCMTYAFSEKLANYTQKSIIVANAKILTLNSSWIAILSDLSCLVI